MKNLRLLPDLHRQQKIIRLDFAFDRELIALVKSQKGARWSQTLQSWYFPAKEFQLDVFYQTFEDSVLIDYSQLKKHSPVNHIIKKKIIPYEPKSIPRLSS